MKKIYLLIILLLSGFAFGQAGSYCVKVSGSGYHHSNVDSENLIIGIKYDDGSGENLINTN
jgi:hypothetical protein